VEVGEHHRTHPLPLVLVVLAVVALTTLDMATITLLLARQDREIAAVQK
jgi:hypothetical protein